jgi:hypothetical protein
MANLDQQLATGLRNLATFIEQNPDLADGFQHSLQTFALNVHLGDTADKPGRLAEYARAAARHRIPVTKKVTDQWHNLILDFDGIRAKVLAYRNEVCERVVTGVETVTKTVPDPEALAAVPTIEVTEQVEQIEWRCRPLLADNTEQVTA